MAVDVQIKNSDEVKTYLSQLPGKMFQQTKDIFAERVLSAETQIKKNATQRLKVRTGTLRRSIQHDLKGTNLKTLFASVFSGATNRAEPPPYTLIHEYGGRVKAKNAYKRVPGGPYLNIPTLYNKTAAGVMRMTAKEVFNRGGFILGKYPRFYVMMEQGSTIVPMFRLIKQVDITARLGMRKATDKEIPTLLSQLKDVIGTDK